MIDEKSWISVFGLGHMGLPTAALLAKKGFNVIGVDINSKRVNSVNSGRSPIMEPGLHELVNEAVIRGKLRATVQGKDAALNSNIIFVIVPTPVDEHQKPDLSAFKSACKTISSSLNSKDLIIIESTVPPGTCENIAIPLLEESGLVAGVDFGIVYSPERALPNNTIYEITHNSRVIGGINLKSTDKAATIYNQITSGKIIKVPNIITAEMVKLMENTYRDTNIALANELAMICEPLGIDAIKAIKAANYHPRVNIHDPGPGVGGHCLSIDPYFIVDVALKMGVKTPLINNSRMINESMPLHVTQLVEDSLKEAGKYIKGSKIGILGVAYKGDVADARETPARVLIKLLIEKGASVYVHDPYVSHHIIKSFKGVPVDLDQALQCDCVVLVTDHHIYKDITPEMIKKGVLVCTRPLFSPEDFKSEGVIFKGVGIY